MSDKKFLFDPHRNPLSRADYRPSEYKIDTVDLHISLDETATEVTSTLLVRQNPDRVQDGPLVLNGEDLKLKSVKIGGRDLDPAEFLVDEKYLIIKNPPKGKFEMEIVTEVNPTTNTKLSGIYTASNLFCSQCEAQGFRRITYYLDRPDNLAVFTTTVEADKAKYPVLLSNGNGDYTKTTDLGNGRHAVTWSDPWPKPSYLFAVVAGDMKVLEDTFTTMTGKKVDLRIFVQPGYEDKIAWAMESIKRAMKWDEDKYGREYDLDCFHIVAVDKFNAGAMENKGLNVFNVSLLVGSPETSTDLELINIEAVLGHEYFHNYTGDRVTLRDWFELTLKEGLTVLRDRQFTSDLHSEAIQTVDDAIELRAGQFLEDSGPAAHSIRPDVVEEFDNIYSSTIYTKGSHVLGMMRTLMGPTVWRLAMDNYFDIYDGQAVTCEDFIRNMEDISGLDLTQFRRWYTQAGTPEISYDGVYDAKAKTYTLTLTQNIPATPGHPVKQDMHIPVAVGLIGQSGKDIPLVLKGEETSTGPTTRVLELTQKTQTFVFENVSGPVVPSVLRGFSAPVKVTTEPSDEELIFRMAHDSDPFNRYEATERLMLKTINGLIRDYNEEVPFKIPQNFMDAYAANVASATDGDLAFAARLLALPASSLITQAQKVVNPDAVDAATDFLSETLAKTFKEDFERIYAETTAPAGEAYNVSPEQVGRRELHNLSLARLCRANDLPQTFGIAEGQFLNSKNMTEKLSALATMTKMEPSAAVQIAARHLENFYQTHKDNPNIVNKWLSLQASTPTGDALERVKALQKHEAFDLTTPNKVSALVMGFVGGNPTVFHKKDGSGYKWLADLVIEVNAVNGKTASRIVRPLTQFKRYDEKRQALMVAQLERLIAQPEMDPAVKELVGQALATVVRKPAAAPKAEPKL